MLSMEVDAEVIHFNIFKALQHPFEETFVYTLDTIDDLEVKVQPLCARWYNSVGD